MTRGSTPRLLPGALLVLGSLLAVPRAGQADELVTPVRVGRSDAPLAVSVWAQAEYSHVAGRPELAAVFTKIFTDWAVARPDIRLDISVMPGLEMHKAKLLLAANADRLPDVASIDSFWMPLFLAGGHLQPLDPEWPVADRADYLPFTISTLSDRAGHVYGMWHGTDCRALYYRKDLVPKPPRTWDELLELAAKISREKGIAGYMFNAGRWEGTVFDHLPMLWAQGGEIVDADGRPVFGLPQNREKLLAILRFLRRAVESGASPRSVLGSIDYHQLSSAAIAGDTAMFLGGNWQVRELEVGMTKAQLDNWDVAPIPQRAPGQMATGTGGWVWVVFAKDPARRKAAIEFLQFLQSSEHVAQIEPVTGHLPVRISVYRDAPFFRDDRWNAKFATLLAGARARPAALIYPYLSEQLQIAIGDVVAGSATPEGALERAWQATLRQDARLRDVRPRAGFDKWRLLPMVLALAAALFAAALFARASVLLWLGPALAVIGLVLIYPIFDLVRLAFSDAHTAEAATRYGLQSFADLFRDPEFRGMLAVTVAFVVASVALQLGLGLLLATGLDAARRARRPGTLFARAAVVSAWVVPGILVGVLWKVLLVENRSGIANYFLSFFGGGPYPWLSSSTLALVSVIAANTWRGSAFSMILLYAALQRVPRELHEAADLEGLGPLARFRVVAWPQIRAVAALNLTLITIATLNTFDLILPLTAGGPARATEVMSLFMYRTAFMNLEAGRAAAVAMIMLLLNLVLAWAALRLMRERRSVSSP